jgi:hypothetical protein
MLTEQERKMLLIYSGLRLDEQVPVGPAAIFEDIQKMYMRLSGGGRLGGREGALAMAIAVILGRASDLERPEIPTESPQRATVKRKGRSKMSAEARKAMSERMKEKWREKREAEAAKNDG